MIIKGCLLIANCHLRHEFRKQSVYLFTLLIIVAIIFSVFGIHVQNKIVNSRTAYLSILQKQIKRQKRAFQNINWHPRCFLWTTFIRNVIFVIFIWSTKMLKTSKESYSRRARKPSRLNVKGNILKYKQVALVQLERKKKRTFSACERCTLDTNNLQDDKTSR